MAFEEHGLHSRSRKARQRGNTARQYRLDRSKRLPLPTGVADERALMARQDCRVRGSGLGMDQTGKGSIRAGDQSINQVSMAAQRGLANGEVS